MGLLKSKSQFYRSLSTLIEAGVHIVRALRQQHPRPFRRATATMAGDIENGEGDLGVLMGRYPTLFTALECRLMTVGQRTGRLDSACTALADWFELLNRLRGEVISDLIYPLLLYHMGCILIAFISVVMGDGTAADAIRQLAFLLVTPWLLLALFLNRKRLPFFGRGRASPLDFFSLRLPLVGPVCRRLNYARFFNAFGLALDAGLGIVDATRLAAGTCTSPTLRTRFERTAESVEVEGCGFVEAFRQHAFPSAQNALIETLLETGETAGNMPEMANRMGRIYLEEAEQALRRLANIVPKLIYFGMAFYVAWKIVRFWSQLFEKTTQLTGF